MSMISKLGQEKETYNDKEDKNQSSFWVLIVLMLMSIPLYGAIWFIEFNINIDTDSVFY